MSQIALSDGIGRIIVYASTKGGVGKTTLVMATATECRRRGMTVRIVDCDPNGYLRGWVGVRNDPGLSLVDKVTEHEIDGAVRNGAENNDITLVDLAGFGSMTMVYAFAICDMIIIPTGVSGMDIAETEKTYNVVRRVGSTMKHQASCVAIITRTGAAIRSAVDNDAAATLSDKGIPDLGVELIERSELKRMTWVGQGPSEKVSDADIEQKGRKTGATNAALNVIALVDRLFAHLIQTPINPTIEVRKGAKI